MTYAYMIVGTLVTILLTWRILIISKRPYRRRELQHHIDMIQDPHGCSVAFKHYEECAHIISHYGIKLDATSLGYGASLGDLWNAAQASTERARLREFTAHQKPVTTQVVRVC